MGNVGTSTLAGVSLKAALKGSVVGEAINQMLIDVPRAGAADISRPGPGEIIINNQISQSLLSPWSQAVVGLHKQDKKMKAESALFLRYAQYYTEQQQKYLDALKASKGLYEMNELEGKWRATQARIHRENPRAFFAARSSPHIATGGNCTVCH